MDVLTLLMDALLLTTLAQVLFALLRTVHRHELNLIRQVGQAGPRAPLRIRTAPDRLFMGGHPQGRRQPPC
jgi:hypothetical protein